MKTEDLLIVPTMAAGYRPADQRAVNRFTCIEDGLVTDTYWSSAWPCCPLRAQRTTSDYRRSKRWKDAAVLEAMQDRLDHQPNILGVR